MFIFIFAFRILLVFSIFILPQFLILTPTEGREGNLFVTWNRVVLIGPN